MNHLNKLTSQLEYLQRAQIAGNGNDVRSRLHRRTAEPTAAINHKMTTTPYWTTQSLPDGYAQSKDEAYYLVLAILNSGKPLKQRADTILAPTNWAK